ncbi:MAG: M28 family peptidase [Bacteroidales bacterium]|nr:M28 family peptidase [Bacteroidales bacterium]
MKKIISIFIIFILCIDAYATKAYVTGQEFAYSVLKEARLRTDVNFLSSKVCAGRLCGTAGNTEAEWLVIRRFKEAGLKPVGGSFMHSFDVNIEMANSISDQKQNFASPLQLVGHNIIGFLGANRKKPSDKYVIILTHHDGHGTLDGTLYGGADSDCSGIVALISLARMFYTHKMITGEVFSKNLLFVSLDAHNYSLQGAYALYEDLAKGVMRDPDSGRVITLKDVEEVINIEQIGSTFAPLSSNNPKYMIMLGQNRLKGDDKNLLGECNRFYKTGLELSYSYYGSESFTSVFSRLSDQRPFVDGGKTALLFTSGITFRTNKASDNAESLDYSVLRSRIILIFRFIEKIIS